MEFKETAVSAMEFNPFNKISKQWMLVTAGDTESSNTMTASWGGVGIMWGQTCGNRLHPSPEIYKGIY